MKDFIIVYNDELYHHGVKGMKWGVRRMQNKYYGSYTKAGIKRFNKSLEKYEANDKKYKDAKKNAKEWKKTIKEFDKVAKNEHKQGLEDPRMPYKAQHELHKQAIKEEKNKVRDAKLARQESKYKLKADYKHLKQDKLADKGKALYASGKTITGNKAATSTLAAIGGLSLAAAAKLGPNRRIMLNTGKSMKAINPATVLGAVGATAIAGATAKKAYDWDKNRKLRAYYGHTSNY